MSIKIDKSVFTASELAQYEQLIAKAMVDPEAVKDEEEFREREVFEKPPKKKRVRPEIEVDFDEEEERVDMDKCNTKKSASPLAAAMERLETLEKSLEMKEMHEIAKKYAPLGEDEEELAQTLYNMRKSDEENYEAYIGILDKSLGLIEKSGLFAEIGKSAYGASTGSTVSKIETLAGEIMKSDSSMSREMAIAKAWSDHPELIAEYDAEYSGR